MRLNVVTAVTRPENLDKIKDSIFSHVPNNCEVYWYLVFDLNHVEMTEELRTWISKLSKQVIVLFSPKNEKPSRGGLQKNIALDVIKQGYVWFLDDDNYMWVNFLYTLQECIDQYGKMIYIFNQAMRDGKPRLFAAPENIAFGSIDTAQFVVHRHLIGSIRLDAEQGDDFRFIHELWQRYPEEFVFFREGNGLVYYNALER